MNKAVLEPRVSPAFAITYFCNHCNVRFENTSKYVDTLTLFSKNLNQRSLTPRRPLTPCLLRSHVWLYPRFIVSKSHGNTSMYVDTVINFANYHIHTLPHTYTYYVHTTYRMSDHIVSYWTQFRRDKNDRFYWKEALENWHMLRMGYYELNYASTGGVFRISQEEQIGGLKDHTYPSYKHMHPFPPPHTHMTHAQKPKKQTVILLLMSTYMIFECLALCIVISYTYNFCLWIS